MGDKIIKLIEVTVKAIITVSDFLNGKKAYIVGGLMLGTGYYQKNNELMLEGLSVIALRAGIKKSGNNY